MISWFSDGVSQIDDVKITVFVLTSVIIMGVQQRLVTGVMIYLRLD